MTLLNWIRLGVVVVAGLLVQVCVLDGIVVAGAHPDVMVLIGPAAGAIAGAQRGAMVGFVAGLAADLVVELPFGLSPLSFVLVGFATGALRTGLANRDAHGARAAVCVVAAAAATVLYAVLAALVGQPGMLGHAAARAVLVVTLGSVVLVYPVLRIVGWALRGTNAPSTYAVPTGGSATA